MFDHYLAAFLASLKSGLFDSWLAASLSLQVEQDARGYFHAMTHMQRLTLADLLAFWEVQPPEAATERSRRPSGTGYS